MNVSGISDSEFWLRAQLTQGAAADVPDGAVDLLCPRNTAELVRMIDAARESGASLVVHYGARTPLSVSGEGAGAPQVIDLSHWCHIDSAAWNRGSVSVEPSVTYRQLLQVTLPMGLMPSVCALDLDTPLATAFANGALGSTSHRFGFCSAAVAYAQVVLGSAAVVHTSTTLHPDVFAWVFGGPTCFGVMTSFEIRLAPAPALLRSFSFGYQDGERFLADLRHLSECPTVEHLHGVAQLPVSSERSRLPVATRDSMRYTIHCATNVRAAGELARVCERLEYATLQAARDVSMLQFFEECHADSARTRSTRCGGSRRACGLRALLPESNAWPLLLETWGCATHGMELSLVPVNNRKRPMALAGPSTPMAIGLCAAPTAGRVMDGQALGSWQRRLYRAGARLLPGGWLPGKDPPFWSKHYASVQAQLENARRRFDPADVLQGAVKLARP